MIVVRMKRKENISEKLNNVMCLLCKCKLFRKTKDTKVNLTDKSDSSMIDKTESELRQKIIEEKLLQKRFFDADRITYWKKLLFVEGIESKNKQNIELSSTEEYQISVDIKRTIKTDADFDKLQGLLRKVAKNNKNIGYCQGMSDIGAYLLTVFDLSDAYKVFSRVLYTKNKKSSVFDKKLSIMPEIIKNQKQTLLEIDRAMYNMIYFVDNSPNVLCDVDFVVFKWILTYFTRFPTLRDKVWDYFVFYGFDIFYFFIAAIFKYFEEDIKEHIKNNTYEDFIMFLGNLENVYIEPYTVVNIVEEYMNKY